MATMRQPLDGNCIAAILSAHRSGMGDREIARSLGLAHKTVAKYISRFGLATNNPRKIDPLQRLMKNIRMDDAGCWPWQGPLHLGYGSVSRGRSTVPAHRAVYQALRGDIPADLELDHTCHTNDSECPGGSSCTHRACVNPDHLEPVTRSENGRRRGNRMARCHLGHAFTSENTYIQPGTDRRHCRTCKRANERRRARARRRS